MPEENKPVIIDAKDMRHGKCYKTVNTKYEGYVKCDLCMHDLDGVLICKVENLVTQNLITIPPDYKLIEISEKTAKELVRAKKTDMGMIGKSKIVATQEETNDNKVISEGVIVSEEGVGERQGRSAEDVTLRERPDVKGVQSSGIGMCALAVAPGTESTI